MKKLLLIILYVAPLFGKQLEIGQEVVAQLKQDVEYAEDYARLNPDPTASHRSEVQKIQQQIQALQTQQNRKKKTKAPSPVSTYATEQALITAHEQKIVKLQQQFDQQMNALKQQNEREMTTYKQQQGALQKQEEDYKTQLEALQKRIEELDAEFAEKKHAFETAQAAVKKAKEAYNEALKKYHINAPTL